MTAFIDASVLVAIIAKEDDAQSHIDRLTEAGDLETSALALWEATLGVARRARRTVEEARALVETFVADTDIAVRTIGEAEWQAAVAAHIRYGRGNHRAALNMGDCFAYACADTAGARLYYKGNDFDHTNLAWTTDA